VVYVMRLFISLLLVWTTLGFILYKTYLSESASLQLSALVSIILFVVVTMIFYSSSLLQRRMFGVINEHKVAIDRIEDLLGRISPNIPREDASQLARFVSGAKKSWSTLIRSAFMEGGDVARVLYKSLLVVMVFFLASLGFDMLGIADAVRNFGLPLLILVFIFTMFITIIDMMHLERLRKQIIRST